MRMPVPPAGALQDPHYFIPASDKLARKLGSWRHSADSTKFPEGLRKLGKHVYWFITKDVSTDTAEVMHRVRYGKLHRASELSLPLVRNIRPPTVGKLCEPCPWTARNASLHKHDWLNYGPLVMNLTCDVPILLGFRLWVWKSCLPNPAMSNLGPDSHEPTEPITLYVPSIFPRRTGKEEQTHTPP